MSVETLRAMATGGMRDHVGGGFHRYSVDAQWRVPHFEKMLYDQAQLVLAYLEGAQASGNEMFAAVAEDTLAYVMRDMRDPARRVLLGRGRRQRAVRPYGTAAPKKEGAFYVWSDAEIATLLGADAEVVRRRFGIEPDGNAPNDPHGEFTGQNMLHIRPRRSKTSRPPPARTPIARSSRRLAGRGRCCSTRARSGRGRTSTTRC